MRRKRAVRLTPDRLGFARKKRILLNSTGSADQFISSKQQLFRNRQPEQASGRSIDCQMDLRGLRPHPGTRRRFRSIAT